MKLVVVPQNTNVCLRSPACCVKTDLQLDARTSDAARFRHKWRFNIGGILNLSLVFPCRPFLSFRSNSLGGQVVDGPLACQVGWSCAGRCGTARSGNGTDRNGFRHRRSSEILSADGSPRSEKRLIAVTKGCM